MKTINYYAKNNYGNTQYYIQGDLAKIISNLTGKKTVSKQDMVNLEKLGFEFVQVIQN